MSTPGTCDTIMSQCYRHSSSSFEQSILLSNVLQFLPYSYIKDKPLTDNTVGYWELTVHPQ